MTSDCSGPHLPRRRLLALLGLGAAAVAAGCARPAVPGAAVIAAPATTTGRFPDPVPPPATPEVALPGGPRVFREGPSTSPRIALTVDDGDCADCVAGYTDFAVRTGITLTLSPNGTYDHIWGPHAGTLAPLVERGQLQVINHTFTHRNLLHAPEAVVRDELERNEAWIGRTLRTTARPWWRPPYGAFDPVLERAAGDLGYDRLVMWSGSYADAQVVTPQFLLAQASMAYRPGGIVLGHANHPAVLGLFDQLVDMLRERGLEPVTLRTLLDT